MAGGRFRVFHGDGGAHIIICGEHLGAGGERLAGLGGAEVDVDVDLTGGEV